MWPRLTPCQTIPPNTVAYFGAIGKGILAGTVRSRFRSCSWLTRSQDGKVSYAIPGLEGEYIFSWNNGKDKVCCFVPIYARLADIGFLRTSAGGNTLAQTSFGMLRSRSLRKATVISIKKLHGQSETRRPCC
jgi:hypothetical protein